MAHAEDHEGPSCGIPRVRCRHNGRKATRMPGSENRDLQDWLRELRPNASWFLLTLMGSVVAAEIISWVPYPSGKAIFIGIGLCMNALLIAWLSWVRTQDNKATTRELTTLLQRIEKLQKALANAGRQRQQREQPQRDQPRQRTSGLENSHPDVAELPSRGEFGDSATSPRWGTSEQDPHRQWARLNAAEKAIVRFVLLKGTATAAQLVQFRAPAGVRSTDTCAGVREKTSFLLGDLESGLTINSKLKAYLETIILQEESLGRCF